MPKRSILAIKKGEVSPAEYTQFITSLKAKIRSAQIKATVTVNNLSFGFVSLRIQDLFGKFCLFVRWEYDHEDMPSEQIDRISSKIPLDSEENEPKTQVNSELIKLYREIGKDILEKQEKEAWGSKVLEKVAKDLQNEFPGIEGFFKS